MGRLSLHKPGKLKLSEDDTVDLLKRQVLNDPVLPMSSPLHQTCAFDQACIQTSQFRQRWERA